MCNMQVFLLYVTNDSKMKEKTDGIPENELY